MDEVITVGSIPPPPDRDQKIRAAILSATSLVCRCQGCGGLNHGKVGLLQLFDLEEEE